jgi:polar amino acid transport system substrate-binding protein
MISRKLNLLFKFILPLICIGMLVPFSAVYGESINDLTFITEQYPPFNFEENGQLKGISVDLIEEVFKKAGSTMTRKDIKLYSWARGYNALETKKNTCLFACTKTEARTPLFKWFGPIAKGVIAVVGKKSKNITISSIEDLKKYKVAVVRDDVGQQLLVEKGIDKGNLVIIGSGDKIVNMLDKNRVDLWAYEESVAKWMIKSNGLNASDYEKVYTLNEGELFYALHKDTSDSIVTSLQTALDMVRKEGKHQEILDNYLK